MSVLQTLRADGRRVTRWVCGGETVNQRDRHVRAKFRGRRMFAQPSKSVHLSNYYQWVVHQRGFPTHDGGKSP